MSAVSLDDLPSAMVAGRRRTVAPAARLTSAISSSSVETTTSAMLRAASAWRIECTTRGVPASGQRFFRGIRCEPPRAGMMAMAGREDMPSERLHGHAVQKICVRGP